MKKKKKHTHTTPTPTTSNRIATYKELLKETQMHIIPSSYYRTLNLIPLYDIATFVKVLEQTHTHIVPYPYYIFLKSIVFHFVSQNHTGTPVKQHTQDEVHVELVASQCRNYSRLTYRVHLLSHEMVKPEHLQLY